MALPDPIFAQGNRLWMKFYTDNSVTHPGYSISYTASFNGKLLAYPFSGKRIRDLFHSVKSLELFRWISVAKDTEN